MRLARLSAAVIAVAVVACSTTAPPDVFFPTYGPMNGGPLALIQGRLVQAGGCLWIESQHGRHLMLWPRGSSVVDAGQRRVIRNGGHDAVVGTLISAVGGEYAQSNYAFVVELIGREVPEPCQAAGKYWLGREVRTVQP